MKTFFTVLVGLSLFFGGVQSGLTADGEYPLTKKRVAIEKQLSTCINNAQDTVSTRECLGKAYEDMDALLNQSYKALRTSISGNPAYAEALKKEQFAWVKLRDAAIQHTSSTTEGTLGLLETDSTALGILTNRVNLFLFLLEGEMGEEK